MTTTDDNNNKNDNKMSSSYGCVSKPSATSLRMGDLGYISKAQDDLNISLIAINKPLINSTKKIVLNILLRVIKSSLLVIYQGTLKCRILVNAVVFLKTL